MTLKNNAVKLLGGMFIASILNVSAFAAIDNMGSAVNKAGQQRMITQRMLKDYALIGMGNTFGDPKKDLPAMISLFDENLKELKAYVKDKAALESLNEVETLWNPIKKTLQDAPSAKKAPKLQEDLETLLKAANKSTGLIAKASGKGSAEIVNISGRQRMLSQRMASLYMLKVWGIKDAKFEEKLSKAIKEFSEAHKKLSASKLNTDEINALLVKSGNAFLFFEMMGQSKSDKYIPSLINRSANKILMNMNKATELYAKQ